MNSIPCPHINTNRWLLDSVLAPHIDAFVAHLNDGRYSARSSNRYLSCIAHFARWLKQSRILLSKIDEAVIIKFLEEHLPRCDCPAPITRTYRDLRAACNHLLLVLRNDGAIPMPALATDPIDEEIRNFDAYMRDAKGLAVGTRRILLSIVRRFLFWRYGKRAIVISALKPSDIRKFSKARNCL